MLQLRRLAGPALAAALLAAAAGCSSTDPATKLTRELLAMPKEDAYARGEALVAKKKYETGRQYLRFVAENYANDPIGKQAALRLADSYFDEHTSLGYLEAQARYKDFRNRYPSHPKSDYALFRLAQCSDRQSEKPDRDQTNTRLAASSYRDLLQLFPDSPYATEARARQRAVVDLLAEHEWRVAHFYLKRKAWHAAKDRLDTIFAAYPAFSGLDKALYDAGLAENRLGHKDEARDRFVRLQRDYPTSPFVKRLPNGFNVTAARTGASGG
jgi:outer membrane protein assembly factor BamD